MRERERERWSKRERDAGGLIQAGVWQGVEHGQDCIAATPQLTPSLSINLHLRRAGEGDLTGQAGRGEGVEGSWGRLISATPSRSAPITREEEDEEEEDACFSITGWN